MKVILQTVCGCRREIEWDCKPYIQFINIPIIALDGFGQRTFEIQKTRDPKTGLIRYCEVLEEEKKMSPYIIISLHYEKGTVTIEVQHPETHEKKKIKLNAYDLWLMSDEIEKED